VKARVFLFPALFTGQEEKKVCQFGNGILGLSFYELSQSILKTSNCPKMFMDWSTTYTCCVWAGGFFFHCLRKVPAVVMQEFGW
jgi:hypothetical protein